MWADGTFVPQRIRVGTETDTPNAPSAGSGTRPCGALRLAVVHRGTHARGDRRARRGFADPGDAANPARPTGGAREGLCRRLLRSMRGPGGESAERLRSRSLLDRAGPRRERPPSPRPRLPRRARARLDPGA